jgi:GT2 family glycosyltransferase
MQTNEQDVPKVLIILVNYKGYADTIECLNSVFELKSITFQVVVIDNSDDEISAAELIKWADSCGKQEGNSVSLPPYSINKKISFELISEEDLLSVSKFNSLVIVKSYNRGFAAANNIALRYGLKNNFSLMWLLNNDTVVEPNALQSLYDYLKDKPQIGILGSKLLFYNNPKLLQGIGGRYNKWLGKISEIGSGMADSSQNLKSNKIDYVIGASMLVSSGFLCDVGLMAEDYFLYYEEIDWALRAKKKGWIIDTCLQSRVYHKGGASINRGVQAGNSKLSDFYSSRNRILIALKFFPYTLITLYPAFMLFIYNRLRFKQYDRIAMLLKIFFSPQSHFNVSK